MSVGILGSRSRPAPPSFVALPKPLSLSRSDDDASLLRGGLRTPPVRKMSTTYHATLPAYDGNAMHGFPPVGPHVGRSKAAMDDGPSSHQRCYPAQAAQLASAAQARNNGVCVPAAMQASREPAARVSTRSSTPATEVLDGSIKHGGFTPRRASDSLVFHSLRIPKCISPNGGALSDLAAQMTCLFWFSMVDNLKMAQSVRLKPPNAPVPRLPSLAKPHEQFRRWVQNVLSTTQVTQNVVFLALLFIYRLKMSTPQIKGRAGSEYRLLTVALMLGNKFLDDNTYTNKTWAEVSSFAVQEIHVMEVEFLSNMRYNLLASKQEWEDWLAKLACFHEYYERALNLPTSPMHVPSPISKAFGSPIPSPTGATLPGVPDLAPYAPVPMSSISPTSKHSKSMALAYQANATSPLACKPVMGLPAARKRSPEGDLADRPAKRPAAARVGPAPTAPTMGPRPTSHVDAARPPVPQLKVVTNAAYNHAKAYAPPSAYAPQVSGATPHGVSLPPLQPGVRAMSTVYQPGAGAAMAQQPALAVAAGVPARSAYQATPLATHTSVSYGTPAKHHSPGSLAPFGSSPLMEHLGAGSAVHTPLVNSPSVYLQQRASPYKPVRNVNRLLYPPSASLDQYHLAVTLPPNQMHYQPLGRRHDVRTGVVPEFVVYHGSQQAHVSSQPGHQGHYPP